MGRHAVTILLLSALLVAGMLFGWRANITFEPQPIKYIPVHYRYPLGWHTNNWMVGR